jgi:outer membrane protein X
MKLNYIFSAALLGASSIACADEHKSSNFYVEAGYTFFNVKEDDVGLDKDLGLGVLKLGYNAHENLAIEVMAGTGLSDLKESACYDEFCASAKVKADSVFGIYAKPKIKLGDAELFARLGYSHTELKAKVSFNGQSVSNKLKEGDFSFGAGVSYSLTKQWYVQADYMRYLDKKGLELSGPTISVGFNF